MELAWTFGASRRVPLWRVWHTALIRSPPALERLFIATPVGRGHGNCSKVETEVVQSCSSNKPLRRQLLQQRLRFFQIARVEPLRKPPVNRSQQFARLLHLALVTPEAREAHGGADRRNTWS